MVSEASFAAMRARIKTVGRAVSDVWARTRGSELVEFAFVLPILLLLFFGILWFARAYNTYETMTQAAREGARLAVAPACSDCSGGGQLPGIAAVAARVNTYLVASALDPSEVQCGTCPGTCSGGAPAICYANGVLLNPTTATTAPEYGVIVSFQYPFQFPIPLPPFDRTIMLSTEVRMRQED